MRFFGREKVECRFCGEMFYGYSKRCPYCAGLQRKKQKYVKEQTVEGDGFILLGDGPQQAVEKTEQYGRQLGNGHKVFLSIICAVIPGIGQLVGAIAGLGYMYSAQEDRRSFGKALFAASIIMFILSAIFVYIIALALTTVPV